MNRKMIIAAASALMLAGTQFAAAATDGTPASFDVTASVQAQCAVGITQTLALGNLTMIDTTNVAQAATDDTQTATFDAICTNGTASPVFKFDSANNAAGVFNMASGANLVKYSLYQGASTSATQIASGTASAYDGFNADGTVNHLSITGKVAAADKQAAPVGSYSDTVTITVSFGV